MMKLDSFLLIFIILILYVILIFIAKSIGWKRKKTTENCTNACPCKKNAPLDRIARKKTDHFLQHLTFRVFNFKRYCCSECEWQGLRWENNFRKKN